MNVIFLDTPKVITPDGEGLIIEIISEEVTVRLTSGITQKYHADQLENFSPDK